MLIFVALLAGTIVPVVLIYNRLINARNRAATAWSDIDVQLQRRHDLVPQLVEAVKAYSSFEKATLEAVATLREEALQTSAIRDRGHVEEKLGLNLARIVALAEAYPDLKANQNFLKLQQQLVETENYLQFARRYYNASVRDHNILIESFPSNLIANGFRFGVKDYFQKRSDDVGNVPLINIGSVK